MTTDINPEDYGPGKTISPEMALAYVRENYHKIILMLILRTPDKSILINNEDIQRLIACPEGTGLSIRMDECGIHLAEFGPNGWMTQKT